MGALSQRPLPKSGCKAEDEKPAIIWSLYGSTGNTETSWFHALSAGKISIFSASVIVALQESFCEILPGDVDSFLQLIISMLQVIKIQGMGKRFFFIVRF